jgi:hypothetical protein
MISELTINLLIIPLFHKKSIQYWHFWGNFFADFSHAAQERKKEKNGRRFAQFSVSFTKNSW